MPAVIDIRLGGTDATSGWMFLTPTTMRASMAISLDGAPVTDAAGASFRVQYSDGTPDRFLSAAAYPDVPGQYFADVVILGGAWIRVTASSTTPAATSDVAVASLMPGQVPPIAGSAPLVTGDGQVVMTAASGYLSAVRVSELEQATSVSPTDSLPIVQPTPSGLRMRRVSASTFTGSVNDVAAEAGGAAGQEAGAVSGAEAGQQAGAEAGAAAGAESGTTAGSAAGATAAQPFAQQASGSASAAAGSATAASQSATQASTARTQSESARDAAVSARDAAQGYATQASDAATTATQASGTASTYAAAASSAANATSAAAIGPAVQRETKALLDAVTGLSAGQVGEVWGLNPDRGRYRWSGSIWSRESDTLTQIDQRTAPIATLAGADADPDQVEYATLFWDRDRRRILEYNFDLGGLKARMLGLAQLRLTTNGVSLDVLDDSGLYPLMRSSNGNGLLYCDTAGCLSFRPSPDLFTQPSLPLSVLSVALSASDVRPDILDDYGRSPMLKSSTGAPLLYGRQDGSIEATLGPDTMAQIVAAVGTGPTPPPIPAAAYQPRGFGVAVDGDFARFSGFDETGLMRPYIFRRVATPSVAPEYMASTILKAHFRDGQSNSRGAGASNVPEEDRVITAIPPRANRLLQIGANICGPDNTALNPSTLADFAPAAERYSGFDRGETGIVAGDRWLDDKLGSARARHLRVLRCIGIGGSTIEELSANPPTPPPGELYPAYANASLTMDRLVAVAALYGCTAEVEDWTWNQGEANQGDAPEVYKAKLAAYIDERATLYMSKTGQTYRPKVFVEILGCYARILNTPTAGLGQLDLCVERPDEVFATSPVYLQKGDFGFTSDGIHLKPLGHAIRAEYTAQARWRVARGELMTCIRPVAPLQITDNVMTQLVSKPDGLPLTLDTDYFPNAAGYGNGPYGFALKADTATVTSVMLEDVNASTARIIVTLSGSPTAATPTLRYAMTGNTEFGDRSPAYGNVRNTNPNRSGIIPSMHLHDWLMPFESTTTKTW